MIKTFIYKGTQINANSKEEAIHQITAKYDYESLLKSIQNSIKKDFNYVDFYTSRSDNDVFIYRIKKKFKGRLSLLMQLSDYDDFGIDVLFYIVAHKGGDYEDEIRYQIGGTRLASKRLSVLQNFINKKVAEFREIEKAIKKFDI